ncbi:MAG TPA: carboxypeptidase-like regulatory domain-containing protein, partial [Arachidicoccus sp.]|nr:carboxypeptidase-like regulatory domain-containing protein [Arachidicoccus sp.]
MLKKRRNTNTHVAHRYLLLVLLLLGAMAGSRASAQVTTRVLSGTVTDENLKPVSGASVHILGTTQGDVTNQEGQYKIQVVNATDSLEITHLNYETRRVIIGDGATL